MARKKKLSREEQKRRRRQKMKRLRQRTDWQPPEETSAPFPISEDLVDDLGPILQTGTNVESVELLLNIAVESYDLVQEPELEDIFFSPTTSMVLFVAKAQEMGIEPDDYFDLPPAEQNALFSEIAEQILPHLFTWEIRDEIVERIDAARARLQSRHKSMEKRTRLAALQFMLEGLDDLEECTPFGLLHAIAAKSVDAGFLLSPIGDEEMRVETLGKQTDAPAESTLENDERFSQILNEIPGLDSYLNREVDNIWGGGLEAVYTGELALDLYTEEELDALHDATLAYVEVGLNETAAAAKKEAERLRAKIAATIPPKRLEQMRDRLATLSQQIPNRKWQAFLNMAYMALDTENDLESQMDLLVMTLLGEIKLQSE